MQFSIVNKNCLDKIVFRLDADFYQKYHITLENKISAKPNITLRHANANLDCSAFYPSIVPYYNFEKKGVPFLRVNEIQNGLININYDTVFLPDNILKENPSTIAKTHPNDIVIAKGGNSLAKVALLTADYPEYAICRDLIVLRTSKLTSLKPHFLWMFLHSNIGQQCLLRTASQTGQPHLTVEAIYELSVPLLSDATQVVFKEIYVRAQSLQKISLISYKEAEQIMLSELGLLNWKPKHKLSFVKKFSNTQTTERIDAEYYQPQYDELVKRIMEYREGYNPLCEIVNLKDKNFQPKDDFTYRYIELANISANGIINGFIEALGKDLPTRARRKVNEGDVIVSTIEGSLSSIALINKDLENALCSTGFFVINSEKINSETLLVLLKSPVGQLQLKKGCSGTILTAIGDSEFKRIILPDLPESIQNDIKKKITEMYNSKALSKRLLDIAKRGVEMAIEKSEKDAQSWINSELTNLDVKL